MIFFEPEDVLFYELESGDGVSSEYLETRHSTFRIMNKAEIFWMT